jgi:hydrogenase expression/formation protein HypC
MCLAIPGRVDDISGGDPDLRWAWVDFAGARRQVSLACVPDARVGDYVLVHAGLAISVIDEDEARRVLEAVGAMGAEEPDAVP